MWRKRARKRITVVGVTLIVFVAVTFAIGLLKQTIDGRGTVPYTSGTGVNLIPIGVLVTFAILAVIGIAGLVRAWLVRNVGAGTRVRRSRLS